MDVIIGTIVVDDVNGTIVGDVVVDVAVACVLVIISIGVVDSGVVMITVDVVGLDVLV